MRIQSVGAPLLLVFAATFGALISCGDDVPNSCENLGTCPPEGGTAGDSNGGTTSGAAAGTSAGGSTGGSAHAGGAGESDAGSGTGGDGGGAGSITAPCGGDCPTDKPVCDESSDTCVECLIEQDCTGATNTKCDTTTNTCVECLMPAHCSTASAARCEGGACVECEDNDDCAHIAGKGVCDGGTCVQCTVEDETPCAGKSCNPATKTCTITAVGSKELCESCVADSECVGWNQADPDARCLAMQFEGTARPGGFCLKRVAKTCTRPFQTPLIGISLSGATSEQYCGIDQDSTRCEAVLDLLASAVCADGMDSSCGCPRDQDGNCTSLGDGGLCRTVGVNANRCTYTCGVTDDCPTGKTCTAGQPYCH
jgi:hypothetical protein